MPVHPVHMRWEAVRVQLVCDHGRRRLATGATQATRYRLVPTPPAQGHVTWRRHRRLAKANDTACTPPSAREVTDRTLITALNHLPAAAAVASVRPRRR